jgi:hypothetical protein
MMLFSAAVISAELYHRAPDVLPGTLPEMQTTGYWIARMANPDEVVLTQDAIRRMNETYEKFISSPDPFGNLPRERVPNLSYFWPGHVLFLPDVTSMDARAIADTVRARVAVEIRYMRSKPFGNALAVEYSPRELDEFEREMAVDTVRDTIHPRPGIAVRYTRLRNVPSFFPEQQGITENAKSRWDQWNVAIVKIARPVTVLYPSRSGEYLFILCEEGYGWVRSEDIAFCDKKLQRAFQEPSDFILCTGDRVQFYSDSGCAYSSGWFGMGDRLPLVSKGDHRRVRVPLRRADGSCTVETAWIASDADVHVGWLPFTRRNVVVTAFKLLDNPYDWSGAWFGRQHETTYRDIFAVFGFRLPWHAALFTFFGHNTEVMRSNIGAENQYRTILQHEPFLTIESCGGHAQLLIGGYNGMPIVFDQHGYGYKDESGRDVEIRRCCIGTVQLPSYFLTRPVTFLELK